MVTVSDLIFGIFFIFVIPIGLWIGSLKTGNYNEIDATISIIAILFGSRIVIPENIKEKVRNVLNKRLY